MGELVPEFRLAAHCSEEDQAERLAGAVLRNRPPSFDLPQRVPFRLRRHCLSEDAGQSRNAVAHQKRSCHC